MWLRRWTAVLALLVGVFLVEGPAATAQPDCEAPPLLAAGRWTGDFEVAWAVRYQDELANQPASAERAPATFESNLTVEGELDLLVSDAEANADGGTAALRGNARATWSRRSSGERRWSARDVQQHRLAEWWIASRTRGPAACGRGCD